MDADCYCDYDPPEFFSRSEPISRTEHKCYECGGMILPGEQYEKVAGKWDGYFEHFKVCQRCHDLRQWTANNLPCLCWAFGHMIEDCWEAIDEAYIRGGDETRGLRFGFLRRRLQRDRLNAERRKTAQSQTKKAPDSISHRG